jgi:hypothetical protein
MKKVLIFTVVAVFSGSTSFAQCNAMFDFQEGTSWQWTNYDKKGKFMGKSMQKIEEFDNIDNGFEVTLSVVYSYRNGEQSEPVSMEMACKDGVVYFDMKKFLPVEHYEDGDISVTVTGDNLEMPTDLKVGDYLRDASVTMDLMGGGAPTDVNLTIDIFNRMVEGEEILHTPVGEFNCFIISQSIKSKIVNSGQIDSREWYSQGTGMIKSETYRKGKIMGYSILTQFSK